MENALIEVAANVIVKFLVALLTIFFTWLLGKLGQSQKLENIAKATRQLESATVTTVYELQQTVVEKLKAANEDHKLTEDEIGQLQELVVCGALDKLTEPTKEMLIAAGADLVKMIHGFAEAAITKMKAR